MPAVPLPMIAQLSTGERVLVRDVRPGDLDALTVGFARLSDQSRFFRFLDAHPSLTKADLSRVTQGNDADRMAIGALSDATPPEPLGIARYIRLSDPDDHAEVAVTVVDSHQRRGLGRLFLRVLASHAQANAITAFVAYVHAQNRGMLALLRGLGAVQVSRHGTEVELRLPLPLPEAADGA